MADVKLKATKAHAAAITVLIMVPLALFGFGDMPTPETIQEAVMLILGDLVAAGIAWLATYLPANKPKAPPA